MILHKNKDLFKQFIDNLNAVTGIDSDIIEKDYYVCMILKDLSLKQKNLRAYFKGGTAVYKILDTMNRFSEDIDLTVEVVEEYSNNKNKTRLENSAFGYTLDGLELSKEDCENNKGSVTGIYKYNSVYDYIDNPLHKPGSIQIEATSFTVSEPYKKYNIEPLIYKLANEDEKNILKSQFEVSNFDINIIVLERIFIDKIFAAEFYYSRKIYYDTAKHLYDITVLSTQSSIINLLNNKEELKLLISYKRAEERVRKGGIPFDFKIKDFTYFKFDYCDELINEFNRMQDKYLLNAKYKVSIEYVKERLSIVYKCLKMCE